MPTFREKMDLLRKLGVLLSRQLASLVPFVQREVAQQVAVEVQRHVVVEAQNQASAFCFQTMWQFIYNYLCQFIYNYPVVATVVTIFTTVTSTLEYCTGLVSEGCVFFYTFGFELCLWAKDAMSLARKTNDSLGLTPKDWFYICVTTILFSFFCFTLLPKIFDLVECFAKKPEPVKVVKTNARGKSPGREKS